MFMQNKVRLMAASFIGVFLLAAGAFIVIKNVFMADETASSEYKATGTYADSTGSNATAESNPLDLTVRSEDDVKKSVAYDMNQTVVVATRCRAAGGAVNIIIEDPANAAQMAAMSNGTQPLCDTTNITDAGVKAQLDTETYPLLPSGYIYYYPSVNNPVTPGGTDLIFVAVEGGADGGNLSCTFTGCAGNEGW